MADAQPLVGVIGRRYTTWPGWIDGNLSVTRIVDTVVLVSGVSRAEIRGSNHLRRVVHARHLVAVLARDRGRLGRGKARGGI